MADKVGKMVLVPQQAFENLKAQQLLNPVPSYLNRLSDQASAILESEGMPTDVKAALYDQMFQQYQSMRNQQLQTPITFETVKTRPRAQQQAQPGPAAQLGPQQPVPAPPVLQAPFMPPFPAQLGPVPGVAAVGGPPAIRFPKQVLKSPADQYSTPPEQKKSPRGRSRSPLISGNEVEDESEEDVGGRRILPARAKRGVPPPRWDEQQYGYDINAARQRIAKLHDGVVNDDDSDDDED
jgi:hypothetical protein